MCSSTDKTILEMDPTGFISRACDNYGIQGAWYCFSDGSGTNSCVTGTPPYSTTSPGPGMCLSGGNQTIYGAAIGLELNASGGAASVKSAYNAAGQAPPIIGFEITLNGDTGGSILNVTFTGSATAPTSPAVTLPGLKGNTPVTYDVLFADALETSVPASPVVNPAAVYDVQVAVPKGVANYNYCITKIKPITAAPAAPATCGTNYGPPFCNTAQFVVEEVGNYGVQNNSFGSGTGMDCVQAAYGGGNCASLTAAFTNIGSTAQFVPAAYPSLVYGWQGGNFYGAYRSANVKQISAITSALTSWQYTASGGSYDASYDIWLNSTAAAATRNGTVELMVWYGYSGANPAGFPNAHKSNATVANELGTWNVYTATMTAGTDSWQYIAYQNTAPSASANVSNVNLKDFFVDAESEGVGITASSYLLGVQAGYELFSGSGTMTTSSFSVDVLPH